MQRLKDGDITERELQRALNRYDSEQTFASMSFIEKANKLTFAVYHGEEPNEIAARYHAITLKDLQEGAKRILDPNKANTLIYKPEI